LFKAKEGEYFNQMNTLSILRINPPKFGGGLKFETVQAKRRSRPSGTQELAKRGCVSKVSKIVVGMFESLCKPVLELLILNDEKIVFNRENLH